MSLFASAIKAPLKVLDTISTTGRKVLGFAFFGTRGYRQPQQSSLSPKLKWYHWPFAVLLVFALDNLFFAVGLLVWICLFYVIALSWVVVFGPIPPVHTW